MPTKYGYIELFSNSPSTLDCEVCPKTYMHLSVRTHLRTKTHQKYDKEFAKQKMLTESAENQFIL